MSQALSLRKRWLILVAVLLWTIPVALSEPAAAQSKARPQRRNDYESWICTKCRKVVGRGWQPSIDKCPHCGARFSNATRPGGTGEDWEPPWSPVSLPTPSIPFPLLVGGGVTIAVLVLGGIVMAVNRKREQGRPEFPDG